MLYFLSNFAVLTGRSKKSIVTLAVIPTVVFGHSHLSTLFQVLRDNISIMKS